VTLDHPRFHAKDAKASALQVHITRSIVIDRVRRTIDFDNETTRERDEIENVRTEWMLAPKVNAESERSMTARGEKRDV
jgi:hypothetical protein